MVEHQVEGPEAAHRDAADCDAMGVRVGRSRHRRDHLVKDVAVPVPVVAVVPIGGLPAVGEGHHRRASAQVREGRVELVVQLRVSERRPGRGERREAAGRRRRRPPGPRLWWEGSPPTALLSIVRCSTRAPRLSGSRTETTIRQAATPASTIAAIATNRRRQIARRLTCPSRMPQTVRVANGERSRRGCYGGGVAGAPRLRRLTGPVRRHPRIAWSVVGVAALLVGLVAAANLYIVLSTSGEATGDDRQRAARAGGDRAGRLRRARRADEHDARRPRRAQAAALWKAGKVEAHPRPPAITTGWNYDEPRHHARGAGGRRGAAGA